jgi:hypothetical protein
MRPLTIGKSQYDRKRESLIQALNSGNAAKFEKTRSEFLAAACKGSIELYEDMEINRASQANREDDYPGPDKLSAVVFWYPEKDRLRVRADVTDAYFSTKTLPQREWMGSCVEIFVCPSGVDGDITQLFVVPEGPENAPRMRAIRAAKWPMNNEGITASWKRTEKGYEVEACIPWSKLKGYKSSYASIPVEIAIDSKAPGWPLQCRMNGSPDCPRSVRGYALLKTR